VPDTAFPRIDISKATADLNNALKEGAYLAVGLALLAFQRAQVHRAEWAKQLEAQREQLNSLSSTLNTQMEDYAKAARSQAATARTQWAAQLSELSKRLDEVMAPGRAQVAKALGAEPSDLSEFGQQLTEASQALERQLEALRAQVAEFVKALDTWMQPAREQLDSQVDRLEDYLPDGARSVMQSVRAAAATREQLLRTAVGLD
jgi:chromosome segregation ATPase